MTDDSTHRDDRLRRAALGTWLLLGVVGLLVFGGLVFVRLEAVLAPLLLALFPAAAVAPIVGWMARHRVPRPVATALILLVVLSALGGLGLRIVTPFLAQLPRLEQSLTQAATRLDALLPGLPTVGQQHSIGDLVRQGVLALSGGVASLLSTALTLGTGLLLVIVVWILYLAGGSRFVETGLKLVSVRYRTPARELADELWHTLCRYIQALTVVAIFDAVAVGIGLWALGVPLVLPLAVLVLLGAYVPFVGTFVSGLVAVLVAFADGGTGSAVAVLILIAVVQQVDGNIIQPLVMGKAVRVSPLTVVVAVAIGASLLGVLGAFLAVPVAALTVRAVGFAREPRPGEAEPGTPPRAGPLGATREDPA